MGTTPVTGLLKLSPSEMVMLAAEFPFAVMGPTAEIVECIATAGPAMKVTFPPVFAPGVSRVRVFTSAF